MGQSASVQQEPALMQTDPHFTVVAVHANVQVCDAAQVPTWFGPALAMHSESWQHPDVNTHVPSPHALYPVAHA